MPEKNVWTCKVDAEHTVRLDDIPARQLADLETELGTNWLTLVGTPLVKVTYCIAMFERCCALAGVPVRELTAGELMETFELVEDDRPVTYSGGLPDPKADDLKIAG
jgi:hypothetical protein